jgi:hypothetical protein
MGRLNLGKGEVVQLSSEEDSKIGAMTEQAEKDIAELKEIRVNFRWDKEHLAVVKKAAEVIGVLWRPLTSCLSRRALTEEIRPRCQIARGVPCSPSLFPSAAIQTNSFCFCPVTDSLAPGMALRAQPPGQLFGSAMDVTWAHPLVLCFIPLLSNMRI